MNIKDSGQRENFGTGSVRDMQAGKGRLDLMPSRALIHLSKLYEAGCLKYGDRNWEKGQPLGKSYVNSGLRHALKFQAGLDDEDHLVAACWNFMCCLDTILRIRDGLLPQSLDDLPGKPSTWPMFGPATPPPQPEPIPAASLPCDPVSQYRLLQEGEIIQKGDEFEHYDGTWTVANEFPVDQPFNPRVYRPYRRPITASEKGYRLLEPDEVICEDDEYQNSKGQWFLSGNDGELVKDSLDSVIRAYRRRV